MRLLALDPSINRPGWALFDGAILIACGVGDATSKSEPIGVRAMYAAQSVLRTADVVVYEWPKIRTVGKGKGDPNDLLGLAAFCGVAAAYARIRGATVVEYLPNWTQLSKSYKDSEAFTSARGHRIMDRLAPSERALVPQKHDAVDAVGLGLFHLGRLTPRRVFAGATP